MIALPRRPLSIALMAVISTLPLTLHAQNTASTSQEQQKDSKKLDHVVVTASGYEQVISEAPASISVITAEQLRSRPYENLADAVRDIEGVSVQGYDPGTTDILIRGMPGEYTLLLVDGKRQSTRETMNRGTTGVQANLLPPLDAIERIEVIRGSMSSLYGSDAIGGVINVIMRKRLDHWQGSVTLAGTHNEHEEHGNSRSASFWFGGPVTKNVTWQAWGGARGRDEDDIYYPRSFTSGADDTRQRNFGTRFDIQLAEYQRLTINAGSDRLQYTARPGLSLADGAPVSAFTRDLHERHNASVGYAGQFDRFNLDLSLMQEQARYTSWTQGVRTAAQPELTNTVFDAMVTMPRERHTLKAGMQYMDARLKGIGNQDMVSGYRNVDEAGRRTWSLFAEDEFQATERLKLTGGLRADKAGDFDTHFSPRLYANYKLSEGWSLRGGMADGFKVPTLRQSTAGYCMSTGGGALVRGPLCGNPDLEPEKSRTFEVGIRKDAETGSFSATLFDTDFENRVVSYGSGGVDPVNPARPLYVYDNISSVRLRGVELAGEWQPNARWRVGGNYTFTQSERHGGGEPAFDGGSLDGEPLDMTPEHVAHVNVAYVMSDAVSLNASVHYGGEQRYAGFRNGATNVRTRPAATTFDLGMRWDITSNLALDMALLNATDNVVPVDPRGRFEGLDGNWYVDEARRLWASLTFRF